MNAELLSKDEAKREAYNKNKRKYHAEKKVLELKKTYCGKVFGINEEREFTFDGERRSLKKGDSGKVVDVCSVVTDQNETKFRFTVEMDGGERGYTDFRGDNHTIHEIKKYLVFDDEDEKDQKDAEDDDILAP